MSDRDGIVRIDATTGSQTLISDFDTAGLRSLGMSFDGSGDLVVVERNNDEVYSVPLPAGGAPTAVTSAGAFGDSPTDVAVESDGSLLVCQRGLPGGDAEIWRVPGGSGTPVLLSLSPSTPNGAPQSLFVVQRACGDSVIQAELAQTCDDGNAAPGDGCNVQCVLEACGDGKLDVGEECDDGNTASSDTCSATCAFEDVYFMNGTADGGAGVSVTLDGVVVAVAPVAGQTAFQVLAALALAINADGALDALGTKATTQGEALYTNGSFTARTNTDTGLAWGARSDLQLENSELEIGLAPVSTMLTVALSQGVAPAFLVWEDGSFTLPSNVFVGTPATATGMMTATTWPHTVAFDVANDAIACNPGTWTPTTLTLVGIADDMQAKIHGPPGIRCVGRLDGHLELLLSPAINSFPLSKIGGPASSATYSSGTTPLPGLFSGTSYAVGGVPWTAGTGSVVYYPPAAWTVPDSPPNQSSIVTMATGNDARRFDGIGALNVVTPIAIRTAQSRIYNLAESDIPGFATLEAPIRSGARRIRDARHRERTPGLDELEAIVSPRAAALMRRGLQGPPGAPWANEMRTRRTSEYEKARPQRERGSSMIQVRPTSAGAVNVATVSHSVRKLRENGMNGIKATLLRLSIFYLSAALPLWLAGSVLAAVPCVVPDNGSGTADLPPLGCEYVAADVGPGNEVYLITDGLPPGSTLELTPTHGSFVCNNPGTCSLTLPLGVCEASGGGLGGDGHCAGLDIELTIVGTGVLAGFNRTLTLTTSNWEVHTAARTPGDPQQIFNTELVEMQGDLFGDPDFDTVQIRAGSAFGMSSPGSSELRQIPGGDFNVVSTIDVSYSIEFVGAPGSIFEGLSGTSFGTLVIETGVPWVGVCGDGGIDLGEECDDGNTLNGDGCSAACEDESVYFFMNGTAVGGGSVSVTLDGVVVAVAPSAGQTAAQALAALAAAINADLTLDALGTKATANGEMIETDGAFTERTNTDAGLSWGARGDLQLENSELEFQLNGLTPIPKTITLSQGVAPPFLVWEDGSFDLAPSIFVGTPATARTTTTPISGTPVELALDVANGAIGCSPAGGTSKTIDLTAPGFAPLQAKIHGPPGARCVGALSGHLEVLLPTLSFPTATVPLSKVGGTASQDLLFTLFGKVRFGGVPWTVGTASQFYYPGLTTTAAGTDARGFDGVGDFNAVTPIAIRNEQISPPGVGDSPGFATLRLHFVPEPGAFAMLGAGSALLALMSWRRSSRRGRRR